MNPLLIRMLCFVFATATIPALADSVEEKMQLSTVRPFCAVEQQVGTGSGFVVGDGGYVVTNWHVVACIAQGGRVGVLLALDNVMKAEVVWHSQHKDLAILRLAQNSKRPAVEFASHDTVKIRDPVTAAGFPGAADKDVEGGEATVTLTTGVVSRIVSIGEIPMYQVDASINPGNSGGPLFNEYGQVIGVNAQKALTSVQTVTPDGQVTSDRLPLGEGIGWAIQADQLFEALDKLHIPYFKATTRASYLEQLWSREPLLLFGVIGTLGISLLATGVAFYSRRSARIATRRSGSTTISQTTHRHSPIALRPILRGVRGHYANAVLELPAETLVIGRDPQRCQLVMPGNGTQNSKRHCSLRYDAHRQVFQLQDCGSTNGTFKANGIRLAPGEPVFLQAGERFYLGEPGEMFEVNLQNPDA